MSSRRSDRAGWGYSRGTCGNKKRLLLWLNEWMNRTELLLLKSRDGAKWLKLEKSKKKLK
jgi:hypothetical protein